MFVVVGDVRETVERLAISLLYASIRRFTMKEMIPIERVENKIYLIRGEKVMLDFDLAYLYGVQTKVLNQAVKRNVKRFPEDFMFLLSKEEIQRMSQIVTSSRIKYHKRVLAFTENGVAMLSAVLKSQRAVEVSILIMRAFTRLRRLLYSNKDIEEKLKQVAKKVGQHDIEIGLIINSMNKLIDEKKKPKRRIGFMIDKEDDMGGKQ